MTYSPLSPVLCLSLIIYEGRKVCCKPCPFCTVWASCGLVLVCATACEAQSDRAVSSVLSVFLLAALQLPHLLVNTISSFIYSCASL